MPVTLTPISSKATLPTAINSLNTIIRSLTAENVTKTVSQSGGSAVITGKLSNGTYGQVIYDTDNTPRILVGQKSDGEPIIAISVKGKDVLELVG